MCTLNKPEIQKYIDAETSTPCVHEKVNRGKNVNHRLTHGIYKPKYFADNNDIL